MKLKDLIDTANQGNRIEKTRGQIRDDSDGRKKIPPDMLDFILDIIINNNMNRRRKK